MGGDTPFKETQDFPWAKPISGDRFSARCDYCKADISVKRGLKVSLSRHEKTPKHENAAKLPGVTKQKALHLQPNSNSNFKEDIIKAEVVHVLKMVVSNSPFSNTESSNVRISALQFPDSSIAKSLAIGDTKQKYILKALAKGLEDAFSAMINNCHYFGLNIDESLKSTKSKLEFHISYMKDDVRHTEFLDTVETYDQDQTSS